MDDIVESAPQKSLEDTKAQLLAQFESMCSDQPDDVDKETLSHVTDKSVDSSNSGYNNEVVNSNKIDLINDVIESPVANKDGCNNLSQVDIMETSPVITYNLSTPVLAINYSTQYQENEDNFTKGCVWSPDGSCLLVASNDKKVRLYNLPDPVATGKINDESWFVEGHAEHQKPAVTIQEGESIYDHCWYPLMNSNEPRSCCFAVCSRDQPVHLWDAWDGSLICNYQPFNHLDQMIAAYSINFSNDGTKLLCGFKKAIRVFSTARPGRQCTTFETKEHLGIISCFATHPQLPQIFAAGSYHGSIGMYSHNYKKHFLRLEGHDGGVTHLLFSKNGTKLFSGARKDDKILCWDIRNPGAVLWCFNREVDTNQRIYMDMDPIDNNILVSGSTDGNLLSWNLNELPQSTDENSAVDTPPSTSFKAHKDCVSGVSFHPNFPILATSSGQRHFPRPVTDSDNEVDGKSNFSWAGVEKENTVKLWWLGQI